MTFLDEFLDDMIPVTIINKTKGKNSFGEVVDNSTAEVEADIILQPIGVVWYDTKYLSNQVALEKSTHLAYMDTAIEIKTNSTIQAHGNDYDVIAIEWVPDFGGDIDHNTAFLVLRQ